MACTVIHTNPRHAELVSKQLVDLFTDGKKPTIKDPFIIFMHHIYKHSKLRKLIEEACLVMSSRNSKEIP